MASLTRGASGPDFSVVSVGLFAVVMAFVSLFIASRAVDPGMAVHAGVFALAFVLGVIALSFWTAGDNPTFDPTRYEDGVVKAGVAASMFWGIAGLLVGVVIALQLHLSPAPRAMFLVFHSIFVSFQVFSIV